MSITSIIGGLAEAALLVLIARIALALASDDSSVTFNLGPVHDWTVSVTVLLSVAAALVLVRMAFQAMQTVLAARATYATVAGVRKSLIRRFLAADWALQSQQREGRLQELATTYATATSSAVGGITGSAISGFNLLALLATALAVSPLASIAAAAAALLVGLVLRPLRLAVRRRSAKMARANLVFATAVTELTSTLQEVRIFQVERPIGDTLSEFTDEYTRRAVDTAYWGGAIAVLYQGIALFFLVGALGGHVRHRIRRARRRSARSCSSCCGRSTTPRASRAPSSPCTRSRRSSRRCRKRRRATTTAAIPRDGAPLDHIGDVAFDEVSFEYEEGRPGPPERLVLRAARRDRRHRRAVGRRQVDAGAAAAPTPRSHAGAVRSDGRDVDELSLDSWYRHFTFVPQEPRAVRRHDRRQHPLLP